MGTKELIEISDKYGAHNYKPLPVMLTRAAGAKVWDVDGKEYLDFLACYSALNFGHQHPALVATLKEQVSKIAVCSRAYYSEELAYFVKELADFCSVGIDDPRVLVMNSGTEAVETALKLARKWGYLKRGIATGQAKIIAMQNNFHGRTISVVSFSTEAAYREDFGPFTPGFELVPYGDFAALEKAFDENTIGVLMEPIQAEAGILVPPAGYLKKVQDLCRQKKALFMLDEIQTGLARTGKNFCFEHDGLKPDVLILGKSLGGGLIPVSAVVARPDVMEVIKPGQHGSTFGGNPLGAALARRAIRLLREEGFSERSQAIGERIFSKLRAQPLKHVKEIRGKGALIGIELDSKAGGARRYCEELAKEGVLCKETHDHVIRIAPPLVISDADIDRGVASIISVINRL